MDVKSHLMRSFEAILDRMAFMYFEEPEDGEPIPEDFHYITGISFKGAINGTLNVFFNKTMSEELARNLVGIREDDELFEKTLTDGICEFTNMIMGHTMTDIDPARSFDMDVPVIISEPTPRPDGMETIEISGLLDEYPIKLVMHYQLG